LAMPRFQFSLAWMLVFMTAIAVLLWLSLSLGMMILASFVWCVVPTPLVICALFARGSRQAFAIGALIPWLAFVVLRLPPTGSFISMTVWLLALGAICGWIAVFTRRWIGRESD
jgi:hypothetical protein